jgi:hypothetical protein
MGMALYRKTESRKHERKSMEHGAGPVRAKRSKAENLSMFNERGLCLTSSK